MPSATSNAEKSGAEKDMRDNAQAAGSNESAPASKTNDPQPRKNSTGAADKQAGKQSIVRRLTGRLDEQDLKELEKIRASQGWFQGD